MSKYIVSLFLLVGFHGWGQVQDTAVQKIEVQRVKPDFKPSAIRGGIDALALARSLSSSGNTTLDIQADVDVHRYFLVAEYGFQRYSLSGIDYDYQSNGSFYRFGVDIDFMPYNQDRSTIYMGLRYARSSYNESLSYQQTDSVWQDVNYDEEWRNQSARWIEIVSGIKARVAQGLFLGYIIRYKIFRRIDNVPEFDSYEVPGYGLGRKNTNISFGFYAYYRFAFRYKGVPPKPPR